MKKIESFDIKATILAIIIMSLSICLAYDNIFFILLIPGCIQILFYVWFEYFSERFKFKKSKYKNTENLLK